MATDTTRLAASWMPTKYTCCKCGGPCDGSLGTDPICSGCARKHYPAFMKQLDSMLGKGGIA